MVEKIKDEIGRLKALAKQFANIASEDYSKGYDEGQIDAFDLILSFIEALKKKQPQGLDSQEDNLARFAMYWYGDDKRRVYLSNVFVGEGMRHKGEGTFILNAAEAIAKMAFADEILLKVKKGSFAYDWYKRHGYVDVEPDEEDKTMIWMKKEV